MNDQNRSQKLKELLPMHPPQKYKPIGVCIYCGNTTNLSDEHIIPLGLGGRMELPKASCSVCSEKTSFFEMICLRTMYGPLRQLYGLPSRRKKKLPKKLPLKVKYKSTDDWTEVLVDQVDYPFLLTFPYFSMPNLITGKQTLYRKGAATNKLWIRGASAYENFFDHLQRLTLELQVHSIMPEAKAQVQEFCQLLAKIGHSFAVAELGYGNFKPLLLGLIVDKELSNCANFIGSLDIDEKASRNIHELSIYEDHQRNYIIVRMRFLAILGTPTYHVVVGQKN
ncbi:MAG: hypothetical protein A2Y10_06650 [Planctomycetes bacterium GWF2_41_51]|nr:MAG: hypothetical protein A2Y10_06650 [Planctomycetes bacterium GWF2_41_51]HBG28146.1 hypothetical protein [Phycisphaerales bacterium]